MYGEVSFETKPDLQSSVGDLCIEQWMATTAARVLRTWLQWTCGHNHTLLESSGEDTAYKQLLRTSSVVDLTISKKPVPSDGEIIICKPSFISGLFNCTSERKSNSFRTSLRQE